MKRVTTSGTPRDAVQLGAYARRLVIRDVPKYELSGEPMPADAAYQLIRDELNLDGNPSLNLASFVTTWMEPEADRLAADVQNRNFIDEDEYPQTAEIHKRVIAMTARLFGAPDAATPVGTATAGSSEAIMLGLLAHKWSWRKRREAAGADLAGVLPNMVMGADVHTSWEKFARYFDVEARIIPMEEGRYTISADEVEPHLDENTIAVGAVLGTTFTGQADDIGSIASLLDRVEAERGWDIALHVDAASGGFIAPFLEPEREWDFRLPRVRSINVSNHKFGLVYPGMGTLVFRDEACLPEELIFEIDYLGGSMPNYGLNFSRPATQIVLQYYNFLRLGRDGYKRIMSNARANAHYLEKRLTETGLFSLLNDVSFLPIVAVRLDGEHPFDVFDLSEHLRRRGWIVPAYRLPANAEKVEVLRMVVRENVSRDMAEMLVADIEEAAKEIGGSPPAPRRSPRGGRHPIC